MILASCGLFYLLFFLPAYSFFFFFFNDTATTEIYTLSLHDALPIFHSGGPVHHRPRVRLRPRGFPRRRHRPMRDYRDRSEEHTSELQSRENLVCRLLLEKKKKKRETKHKNYKKTAVIDVCHLQCQLS